MEPAVCHGVTRQPKRITTTNQSTATIEAPHKGSVVAASQPRWIQALPSRPMNSRSPRVVDIGKKPRRSTVGHASCKLVISTSIRTIAAKKIAVGGVQYIDWTSLAARSTRLASMARPSSDPAQGEALGHVVAHEPDHEGTRQDGHDAGGRQRSPVDAGSRDGAGHRGCNGLGVDR